MDTLMDGRISVVNTDFFSRKFDDSFSSLSLDDSVKIDSSLSKTKHQKYTEKEKQR